MIKVGRLHDGGPEALNALYSNQVRPPKIKGKTELEAVIQHMKKHREKVEADKAKLIDFKYPYERYSDPEVVEALRGLFHGKCAYCESRYAGTQPMDVEHWRPKGKVRDNVGQNAALLGYYWLASTWTNLLPSCIDCNRARTQFDAYQKKKVLLGKKNQFPVVGDRTTKHEDDPDFNGGNETVLLLNPCKDDPEKYLRYDEQGCILPKSEDEHSMEFKRAMASIRVYALNRSELVADRLANIQIFEHRIRIIDKLGDVLEDLKSAHLPTAMECISDVIATEIDILLEMTKADKPYAGLARQLVKEADPL